MENKQIIYEHSRLAVDLLPEEKVLNVQRQHPISLALLFLIHALILTFIFGSLALLFTFKIFPFSPEFFIFATFLFLSALALIGTYTCMKWYFTFYIITTNRLIIRQYFKVVGAYYQELLLRRRVQVETKRVMENIVYDLLDIEDIYVTIHTEDLPEPFIFKIPNHPELIEKALSEIEKEMLKV